MVAERVDLSRIVRETARLLEAAISRNSTLRFELAAHLPAIEAESSQVRQVVMNLITNASEALQGERGEITVRTGITHVGRADLRGALLGEDLPEGDYVFVSVGDTGGGIPPEVQKKIFDPFFTTKFTGRGLGLAAVLGIVRGHHGAIRVASQPGRGTTFQILLPATGAPAEEWTPAESAALDEDWRGAGTVLVIDDDPVVRNVARRILQSVGLGAMLAEDGRDGIDRFAEHADEIVAVVLDMTMPGLRGDEVADELRRLKPGVRLLLSSGYDESDVARQLVRDGLAEFIHKPYEKKDFIGRLRRVLGS
jgi:CheY-like chemotaxis protein